MKHCCEDNLLYVFTNSLFLNFVVEISLYSLDLSNDQLFVKYQAGLLFLKSVFQSSKCKESVRLLEIYLRN